MLQRFRRNGGVRVISRLQRAALCTRIFSRGFAEEWFCSAEICVELSRHAMDLWQRKFLRFSFDLELAARS